MSVRRVFQLVSAFVVFVLASLLAVAQAPKPAAAQPQLLLLSFAKVRPGMAPEYITLQTKEVMPAQMKGGAPGRQAYSSGISGPPGEFVYITPIASLAQFDEPSPLSRALGQEGAAALNARIAKVAEPIGTAIVRTRPDLSHIPDPQGAPAPLAVITVVEIVPGRRLEFEAFLKKEVVPAIQKAKARSYHVMEVVYGENTGGFITAIGFDSYASIGKGHPFIVALGEEGAQKLEAKAAGLVNSLHRFISRHRPELSWSPAKSSND